MLLLQTHADWSWQVGLFNFVTVDALGPTSTPYVQPGLRTSARDMIHTD